MKLRCYYAHPITDYNTWREIADVYTLKQLGFDVLNPNSPEHDIGYKLEGMAYFEGLVDQCEILAFRGFNDGTVPAGVWTEVSRAVYCMKPVIELPNLLTQTVLSVEETRAKLKELGRA